MLPFLKPKQVAGIIIAKHKASGGIEPIQEAGEHSAELMMAAEELIRALHAKDAKAVASCLMDAFHAADEAPHIEGPHLMEGES